MPPERAININRILKRKSTVRGGANWSFRALGADGRPNQSKMKHAVKHLTLAIAGVLNKANDEAEAEGGNRPLKGGGNTFF